MKRKTLASGNKVRIASAEDASVKTSGDHAKLRSSGANNEMPTATSTRNPSNKIRHNKKLPRQKKIKLPIVENNISDANGASDNEGKEPIDVVTEALNLVSQQQPRDLPSAVSGMEDLSDDVEVPICNDPYLLADSTLCKAALTDDRWTNKQRTMVFCSRGVSHRQRHLLEDLKKLFPHSKSEPKWEKKTSLDEINEICEMQACNNCIYLETRKNTELYMWMARTPNGPSVRFQVLNIHTLGELKMTGNCLLHSRPLLVFDRAFDQHVELRFMREMFIQSFGTPRNHPKAKPFFDHVFSFMYYDHKIWFRPYQISPMMEKDANKPNRQLLTEIGPRFVLDPIKIFDGSFGGSTLYQNPHYMTPTAIRVLASRGIGSKYAARKAKEHQHKLLLESLKMGKDSLDRSNIFDTTTPSDASTTTPKHSS